MAAGDLKIVTVGSSSKKAGKSSLAATLVSELGARYGLKVGVSGRCDPGKTVITDEREIARPGTDTGALVEAGAEKVVWVRAAEEDVLARELDRALRKLGAGGILVAEGNSAGALLEAVFSVFVMAVPFSDFKPSARGALERADLVLVDRRGALKDSDRRALTREIHRLAPGAKLVYFRDEEGRRLAWETAVRMAREALVPGLLRRRTLH